jgi:predicted Zn-dependent peptidase
MTLYWAKVAAAHQSEAMDVLSDMLLHAIFDPAEMEKERAVISEEINYSLDAPDSLVQLLVNQLQWPNHPLGRDVAGTRQSVGGMSREALLTFMAQHYRPNQTILGLAGQVDHAQAVAWAEANLADWEPGSPSPCEAAPPDHRGPGLHVERRDTEQAHLSFSFSGLSRRSPDRFALRLLNVILGEGMRSRLFQEVRERLGLAYSIESYVSALDDAGSVGIYAGVGTNRTEEAIHAILGELDRLRQEPIPEDELQKAVEFVRGRLALLMEDSFSLAAWYSRQELLGPEVLGPEESVTHLEAVKPAEIQRLAQTLFQEERLNLAIVGPLGQKDDDIRQVIRF